MGILTKYISWLFPGDSSSSKIKNIGNPKTTDFGEVKSLEDICQIFDKQPDLKIASFDFMNTLVEWTSSVSERHTQMHSAAEAIFKEHGYDVPADEYKAIRDKIWYQHKKEHYAQGKDFKINDALIKIVSQTLETKKYNADRKVKKKIAQDIEEAVYQVERQTAVLAPKARETLQHLKDQGKKIVLYSNTPFSSIHVEETLDSLGILDYFDKVVASSDHGFQKSPHNSKGFQKLAWEIKQESEQFNDISVRNSTLHIGDSFNDDYQGALNAGLRAVHYKPQSSLEKKLEKSKPGSKKYSRKVMDGLRESLNQKVEGIINQSLSEDVNNDYTKDLLLRIYGLSRDIAGPVFTHFSERRLKSLIGQPKKLAACLGRDGLGPYEIIKTLLELSPQSYPGVDGEQIKYLNFSRQVMSKAFKDSGFESMIGYEGKKIEFPPDGENGYSGYRELLEDYLKQFGFDEASEIMLIDSGLQGSTQSAIQTLFPDWQKKIKGKYLYCFQKFKDKFKNDKDAYLLLFKGTEPNNKFGVFLKGKDDFYLNQSNIYFFEDLFNGFESSNSHLDERVVDNEGDRIIEPRVHPLDYHPAVDPEKIPDELKHAQVYRLAKDLVIEGLKDSAAMFARNREIDPTSRYNLFPNELDAEKGLRQYLEGYLEFIGKGTLHADSDIFNTFLRKLDYRKHEEKYKELWTQQIKP